MAGCVSTPVASRALRFPEYFDSLATWSESALTVYRWSVILEHILGLPLLLWDYSPISNAIETFESYVIFLSRGYSDVFDKNDSWWSAESAPVRRSRHIQPWSTSLNNCSLDCPDSQPNVQCFLDDAVWLLSTGDIRGPPLLGLFCTYRSWPRHFIASYCCMNVLVSFSS